MADFEAKVYKLIVEEHPNADALELARVGDYRSIVRKGQFKTGDLGVYIPEQAICPQWLIEALGLTGKLAGKAKNRVKAVKLRGVLSQGLIYPIRQILAHQTNTDNPIDFLGLDQIWVLDCQDEIGPKEIRVEEGDDATEFLGIKKYEPVIPSSMSGEVETAVGYTLKYDIENIKKYPNIFQDGEEVYITEKLHGTWCCFSFHPEVDHPIVTSKGLSAQGLIFKFNKNNERNLYIRTFKQLQNEFDRAKDVLYTCFEQSEYDYQGRGVPFYILGEIYGPSIQDLHYGEKQPKFRAFDLFIGDPSNGVYERPKGRFAWFDSFGIEHVPLLYHGPFSAEVVEKFTNGKESISGDNVNVREGIVITPARERRDEEIGRVILKSISDDYLLRKGGTEYN